MKIPHSLKRRAATVVRAALVSSAAATTATAGEAQAAAPDGSVQARVDAIRAALARQAESSVPSHDAARERLAQWPNGSGWRNGGWRNY